MNPRLQGFDRFLELMWKLDSGRKYTAVNLYTELGNLVMFRVAGKASKYASAVNVFINSEWIGRILINGTFRPGLAAIQLSARKKRDFWDLMLKLKYNDLEHTFQESGRNTSICCICSRELTEAKSRKLGIGPTCRKRAFGEELEVENT